MKAFKTLLKTEIKLSIRHTEGIIFGILFPLFIACLLGIIFGDKAAYEGANYTFVDQSFGAVVSISICATALMGIPLTIADYRDKKILKKFKVTPISPGLILLVEILIQFLITTISLISIFIVWSIFFNYKFTGSVGAFLLSYILVLFSIDAIGMMIASVAKDVKKANFICNIVYFPMLFLSGTTIPYEIMPESMHKVQDILPLTQGVKLLKATSLGIEIENMFFSIGMLIAFFIIGTFVSLKCFKWE